MSCLDYELGVQWLYRLLHCVHFDVDRIIVLAKQMINSCAELRQDGQHMTLMLMRHNTYTHGIVCSQQLISFQICLDSMQYLWTIVRQEYFLRRVVEKIQTSPDEIIATLTELYKRIAQPEHSAVHIMCDATKIRRPVEAWTHAFAPITPGGKTTLTTPIHVTTTLFRCTCVSRCMA